MNYLNIAIQAASIYIKNPREWEYIRVEHIHI